MSLKDLYQTFLADPKSASLASDVSLIYIPTTTKIDGADAVRNHLTRQDHVLKRKSQQVLDTIEGPSSLCLDVEATVEFVSGGGPYLLALDDNFLSDRVATFPTVHIVRFNSQNQIQNVRVYWDQASLLKQVEVIGARGRVWPIRDAKDQTRLIKSTVVSTPSATTNDRPAPTPAAPTPSLSADQENTPPKRVGSPGKKHIKDPYASESLFDLLSPTKDREQPVRAPRAPASAKPPQRDLSELFVGDDDADAPDPTPSKPKTIAPKAGAGKHFKPSRIFGGDDEDEPASTPVAPKVGAGKHFRASRIFDDDETVRSQESHEQIAYRAHPKRFEHFELGADNSEREIKPKTTRPLSRQGPQWNFEDFATPEKPRRQLRGEEVRHFGWSDDEPDLQDSPPAKPRMVQPRRDAETHFQLTDEMEEPAQGRIISSFGNRGKTLYNNPLYNEADDELPDKSKAAANKAPLSIVQNGPNRKKDFESHWGVTDELPARSSANNTENQKPIAADRQKAVRMMEAQWEAYDESPQPSKPQPLPPHRQSVREINKRSWNIGDE
ncbi:hypothetical protein HFD88_009650 [Aspergillus terreus]|nr:hypothetical protein HFD88_009650 [Aspergillus terreus]